MVTASGKSAQKHPPRHRAGLIALVLQCAALGACGGDGADPPILTRPPRASKDPKPNAGNALFTSAGPLEGVALREVLSLPSVPIYFVSPPGDERLFIVQRNGAIRILSGGKLLPRPFLDLGEKITEDGEGGLLSIAFHPRYGENGLFFVNYTDTEGDTVIARYRRTDADPNRADPASAVRLFWIEQPYSNHNGGQLQFGPDGYL